MGLRKLNNKERKTLRAFADAALSRGEHKDDVIADVTRLLVYPGGWERDAAKRRAVELVTGLAHLARERPQALLKERDDSGARPTRK